MVSAIIIRAPKLDALEAEIEALEAHLKELKDERLKIVEEKFLRTDGTRIKTDAYLVEYTNRTTPDISVCSRYEAFKALEGELKDEARELGAIKTSKTLKFTKL